MLHKFHKQTNKRSREREKEHEMSELTKFEVQDINYSKKFSALNKLKRELSIRLR